MARGDPIFFHLNMPHTKVLHLLSTSKIYWHARGYSEEDPNEYENFGITTVESMAAGCIPIVINLGGQKEIIRHKKNGLLWNNPSELLEFTNLVIKNTKFLDKLKRTAIEDSKKYSSDMFIRKIEKEINPLS